jgi:adenosylhomocysteine nucleosidase
MARFAVLRPGFERKVMPEIAIVAALEREIWPMIRTWRISEQSHSGKRFRFFEAGNCVAVSGGIGPAAARRAAEAIVTLYHPTILESVGFAGALEPGLRVGDVLTIRRVIDATDGSRADTGHGDSTLVSFSSVAGRDQKQKLANSYGARVVDMEAAAVAKSAQAHAVEFRATKVVSDEIAFPMPPIDQFITSGGQFQSARFAIHVALRPWTWATAIRLGRNSTRAANALSDHLMRNFDDLGSNSQAIPATQGSRP